MNIILAAFVGLGWLYFFAIPLGKAAPDIIRLFPEAGPFRPLAAGIIFGSLAAGLVAIDVVARDWSL